MFYKRVLLGKGMHLLGSKFSVRRKRLRTPGINRSQDLKIDFF
jgi:hypothetical protein